MTPSELYAYNFQNPEPKYYSRIPHIIDHLTYDSINEKTGEKEIKRLSVYAKELYRVIKSIANEDSTCWMHRDKLADLCNFSTGMISKAKEELSQNFHQLDGNKLIHIQEQNKTTNTNGTIYHRVMILDIWKWNNAFMATLKYQRQKEAVSPHDSAKPAVSPHDSALQGALSPHDTNNNPTNKNPLSKEQQPANLAQPVCSAVSLNADVSVPSEEQNSNDVKAKAMNYFLKIGCDVLTATSFVERFSPEDIAHGSKYVQNQIEAKRKKGETIQNIVGYLRKTLEGRYWIRAT